jgi:hypothetical protein
MSDNTFSTVLALAKTTNDDYHDYQGPKNGNAQQVVLNRLSAAVFDGEEPPEFIEVTFGSEGLELSVAKTGGTGNSINYQSGAAIDSLYVWPSEIESSDMFGTAESDESAESVTVTLAPSDESSFEEAKRDYAQEEEDAIEEEADVLFAGDDGSEEEEEQTTEEEEVNELMADD